MANTIVSDVILEDLILDVSPDISEAELTQSVLQLRPIVEQLIRVYQTCHNERIEHAFMLFLKGMIKGFGI